MSEEPWLDEFGEDDDLAGEEIEAEIFSTQLSDCGDAIWRAVQNLLHEGYAHVDIMKALAMAQLEVVEDFEDSADVTYEEE